MKKIILNTSKLLRTFDFKTADIVEKIIDACEPIEDSEDAQDAIFSAIDNQLIYCADQWQIISAYSTPEEPMNFSEACLLLEEDIMNCIEEVDEDDD